MQLAEVRRVAGLSQSEWARVAGTSRPTLSAYEHGRKSPTLETVERLLAAVGQVLEAQPRVQWTAVDVGRGRVAWVPSTLPRLTRGRRAAPGRAAVGPELVATRQAVRPSRPR